ncbi:MAG: hypothetical protein ACQET3_10910 [Promethearchaeati archaeon]
MKKSKFGVISLIVALVLLASPLIAKADGAITGINVQNLSDVDEATVTVEYYDEEGVLIHRDEGNAIPAETAINIYPPTDYTDEEFPAGRYSAVLLSDQPVAAVANSVALPTAWGDSYIGMEGDSSMYAPLIYRHYRDYNSILYMQNATEEAQDIEVSLYRVGESSPAVTETYRVPAYASEEVTLADSAFDAFGSGFGSAVISGSEGAVACTVLTEMSDGTTETTLNTQYRGFSDAMIGRDFDTPLIFKGHNLWNTGIMVQNTEDVTTTVSVTYAASVDNPHYPLTRTGTIEIAPNSSEVLYLPDESLDGLVDDPLPDGFWGTAELSSSDSDIAVIVNNVKYDENYVGSSYEGYLSTAATSKVAAPLVYRAHADTNTGISVQNTGTEPTDISLTITANQEASPSEPGPWSFTKEDVAPGEGATFYLPWPEYLGDVEGLYGSAKLTATNDVPIIAHINSPRYAAGISANYRAFNY